MRKLIEQSLLNKQLPTELPSEANVSKAASQTNNNAKSSSTFHHQESLNQHHYESSCVVKSKSYFGSDFDAEKHNNELMYEDLPKPITEFNKIKGTAKISNGTIHREPKSKEASR